MIYKYVACSNQFINCIVHLAQGIEIQRVGNYKIVMKMTSALKNALHCPKES